MEMNRYLVNSHYVLETCIESVAKMVAGTGEDLIEGTWKKYNMNPTANVKCNRRTMHSTMHFFGPKSTN